jgi:hypothetical protein
MSRKLKIFSIAKPASRQDDANDATNTTGR